MRIVLACDECFENPCDIGVGEFVLVALMDKLTRSIDKECRIVLFALLQHDNAGSNADAKEKIGRQLNDGVDVVIVDQVFADFLFGSASVEYTGELDDSRRTVGSQPRKHVHRKGKVGFALGSQNTRRREPRVVNLIE